MCHGQLLSDAIHRARKQHQCDYCRKDIPAGEFYRKTSYISDGDFDSSKACRTCVIKLTIIGQSLTWDYYCHIDIDEDWRLVLEETPIAALRLKWQEFKVKFMKGKTEAGWLQA